MNGNVMFQNMEKGVFCLREVYMPQHMLAVLEEKE